MIHLGIYGSAMRLKEFYEKHKEKSGANIYLCRLRGAWTP